MTAATPQTVTTSVAMAVTRCRGHSALCSPTSRQKVPKNRRSCAGKGSSFLTQFSQVCTAVPETVGVPQQSNYTVTCVAV